MRWGKPQPRVQLESLLLGGDKLNMFLPELDSDCDTESDVELRLYNVVTEPEPVTEDELPTRPAVSPTPRGAAAATKDTKAGVKLPDAGRDRKVPTHISYKTRRRRQSNPAVKVPPPKPPPPPGPQPSSTGPQTSPAKGCIRCAGKMGSKPPSWFYSRSKDSHGVSLPNLPQGGCSHIQKYAETEANRLSKVQEWLRESYRIPNASVVDYSSTTALTKDSKDPSREVHEREQKIERWWNADDPYHRSTRPPEAIVTSKSSEHFIDKSKTSVESFDFQSEGHVRRSSMFPASDLTTYLKQRAGPGKRDRSFTNTSLNLGPLQGYRIGAGPINRPHSPPQVPLKQRTKFSSDSIASPTKSSVVDIVEQKERTYGLHSQLKMMLH